MRKTTPSKQSFLKSIKHALRGIAQSFSKERNVQIQALVALLVIVLALLLKISSTEWMIILLCIIVVICFEMLNTAIELLCDIVTTDYHPIIKQIKDISAGAVLWASIISVIIGLVIFIPKIMGLLF